MPTFSVKVKWGKETFSDVQLNTDDEPLVFKAQLFALTGVQPHRQKVMFKGTVLKDDTWADFDKVKAGALLLLMGTKEEDIPGTLVEKPQFVEDMDSSELQTALQMPAGLKNLGNTCYMNATVQFLKTVPEFKEALLNFQGSFGTASGPDSNAQSITVALRDLFKAMEQESSIVPLVMLQVLHNAFPRFSERAQGGGFQQQDANECWIELIGMLRRQLKDGDSSVIDRYFAMDCQAEVKCVESDDEPSTTSTERFLQLNCYIDKDVRYLGTGLANRLQETMVKHSPSLNRDAEYLKKLCLVRLPAYLTVQMVRFQFKQKGAINAKILKDIKFPLMLDVFDLCSPELQQKLTPMRTRFKEHEDRVVQEACKDKSMSKEAALKKARDEIDDTNLEPYCFENDPGSNNSGYYELQAVLTHRGRSSNSGHYVAWIRSSNDHWFECNDDLIQPIHVEDILKLSGGGDWHTAYLLLYGPRRLPKSPAGSSESNQADTAATQTKVEMA